MKVCSCPPLVRVHYLRLSAVCVFVRCSVSTLNWLCKFAAGEPSVAVSSDAARA